jgi:type IV pilus assembly protein PilM
MAGTTKINFDFMAILNPGENFGLDIGNSAVKVCQVTGSKGKLKIDKFGSHPLSEAAMIEDEIAKPEEVIEAIQSAMRDAGISSKSVTVGLGGNNTMTKRMVVASEGDQDELQSTIRWEAEQFISFGADESEVDFSVLGNTDGGGKDVIVAAARTDVVEKIQELLNKSQLKIKNVDLNVLAVCNLFEATYVHNRPELDEGSIILDYGSQSIKIIVYRGKGPIFTKEMMMGGTQITEEIQRQLSVSFEEAENLKRTHDDNGNPPQEVAGIMNSILEEQIAEIRKNLNFYLAAGSSEKINYAFLTGGTSQFPLLQPLLSQSLGLEVEILNPFDFGLSAKSKFQDRMSEIMYTGIVALGLGMRK